MANILPDGTASSGVGDGQRKRGSSAMRKWTLLLAVLAAGMLQACGGGGGDGGNGGEDSGSGNASQSFSFTITDNGANFQAGDRVTIIHAPASSCTGTPTATGSVVKTASGLASGAPASVTLNFTLHYSGAYLETVYLDVDNSGTLTQYDIVLGTHFGPALDMACRTSMASVAATQTVDWSTLMSLFLAQGTWGPFPQSF